MAVEKDLLIVGLGNPGEKYHKTRHNIGFVVIDYLAEIFGARWNKAKFNADLAIFHNNYGKIFFLKPTNFINLSGGPVQAISSYYKIQPENTIVIHDDIALDNGRLKAKIGGSSGGHNGIKSIDAHIGNNYWRLRIGVGAATDNIEVSDYVLSKPSVEEWKILTKSIEKITDIFKLLLSGKLLEFRNYLEHIARA